jgi:broad specificity phosphatase PhoE
MSEVVLLRHGETAWSVERRHTGRTDLPLTPEGEDQARHASRLLDSHAFVLVLASPLKRAQHTAELAGLRPIVTDDRLVEWDYGAYEGRTTAEIREDEGPDWSIWTASVPPGATKGESLQDVAARAESVLVRIRAALAEGDVAVVAHAHLLRILSACWLGLPPVAGADFALGAGSVSVLGDEHGQPVITRWNLDPTVTERLT